MHVNILTNGKVAWSVVLVQKCCLTKPSFFVSLFFLRAAGCSYHLFQGKSYINPTQLHKLYIASYHTPPSPHLLRSSVRVPVCDCSEVYFLLPFWRRFTPPTYLCALGQVSEVLAQREQFCRSVWLLVSPHPPTTTFPLLLRSLFPHSLPAFPHHSRSWVNLYCVLNKGEMGFYKDAKNTTTSYNNEPRLNLSHCHCDVTNGYKKKKNVFTLK